MLLWILLLVASIAVLVWSSDRFTDAAEQVGVRIGMPHVLVGILIVSIGTSLPELASSLVAVAKGSGAIVVGNVAGSNIANILLVLGGGAVYAGVLRVSGGSLKRDAPFLVGGTFLFFLFLLDLAISRVEAAILLAGFVAYVAWLVRGHLETPKQGGFPIFRLIVSAALVYLGAEGTVRAVVEIATRTGIPEGAIAASVIAFGTSLPELAVTFAAARKRKHDIAVGNIIGSCVFNLLAVAGAAGLVGTLAIAPETLWVAGPALVVATLLLVALSRGDIRRPEGILMLLLYALFLVLLFV